MSEILFRGKLKRDIVNGFDIITPKGSWVYGDLVRIKDGGKTDTVIYGFGDIDTDTLGQFTGFTDENNVKIFKGDIVDFFGMKGIIVKEKGAFGIGVMAGIDYELLEKKIKKITGSDNPPHFVGNDNFISLWEIYWNYNLEEDCCDVVKVIGNKYDSPELL